MKVIAVLLLSCISGTTAAQTLSADQRKEVRKIIEGDIAKETDEFMKMFLKEAKNKGTEEERRLAIQGIQDLFYNKAYNQYRCILLHPTSLSEANECSQKAHREIAIYFKLATDYFSVVAKRSMQCEMQTRLFAEEIEFPPYPFLGKAQLHDYARMIECLRQ